MSNAREPQNAGEIVTEYSTSKLLELSRNHWGEYPYQNFLPLFSSMCTSDGASYLRKRKQKRKPFTYTGNANRGEDASNNEWSMDTLSAVTQLPKRRNH